MIWIYIKNPTLRAGEIRATNGSFRGVRDARAARATVDEGGEAGRERERACACACVHGVGMESFYVRHHPNPLVLDGDLRHCVSVEYRYGWVSRARVSSRPHIHAEPSGKAKQGGGEGGAGLGGVP